VAPAIEARPLARAGALCLVAGFVDAVSYTELGAIFAANMTGNSVLFAIAAARGEEARAASYALTLVVFLLGAIASAFLRRATRRPAVALVAAAGLLLLAAVVPASRDEQLALLACAMGLQGGAITRFGPTNLTTVVVTGTMVRLADTLVERMMPGGRVPAPDTARLDALAWVSYIAGAALAVGAQHVMAHPLILAVIALVAVAAEVTQDTRRSR
jgi:uncharacterized membrane protein YoaK (UPF0700 family)